MCLWCGVADNLNVIRRKPLNINRMEDKKNDKDKYYRKAV